MYRVYYVVLLILYAHYPVALCTLHLQLYAFCYCPFCVIPYTPYACNYIVVTMGGQHR